jgi:hypothetical protein
MRGSETPPSDLSTTEVRFEDALRAERSRERGFDRVVLATVIDVEPRPNGVAFVLFLPDEQRGVVQFQFDETLDRLCAFLDLLGLGDALETDAPQPDLSGVLDDAILRNVPVRYDPPPGSLTKGQWLVPVYDQTTDGPPPDHWVDPALDPAPVTPGQDRRPSRHERVAQWAADHTALLWMVVTASTCLGHWALGDGPLTPATAAWTTAFLLGLWPLLGVALTHWRTLSVRRAATPVVEWMTVRPERTT